MKTFYVITNQTKDESMEMTYRVKSYIEGKGGACVLATDDSRIPKDTDCVLVLGGDGTLIRAARELQAHDVPLLGINMGTLGYLTEADEQDVEAVLDFLMEKKGIVEEEETTKESLSGISDRPNCKGRAYDPNRYRSESTEE